MVCVVHFFYTKENQNKGLWLFLNHFKEPYALPHHSLLSETHTDKNILDESY